MNIVKKMILVLTLLFIAVSLYAEKQEDKKYNYLPFRVSSFQTTDEFMLGLNNNFNLIEERLNRLEDENRRLRQKIEHFEKYDHKHQWGEGETYQNLFK